MGRYDALRRLGSSGGAERKSTGSESLGLNERLRRFLVENLQAQPEGVATDDSPLLSTHIVDSLGLLEVLSFLHDELGVVIADDEVVPENFETIGAIVRLLESKRG